MDPGDPKPPTKLYVYIYNSARRLGVFSEPKGASCLLGLERMWYLLHGSHLALEMAARSCLGATRALEMAARACSGATWALEVTARSHCSKELVSVTVCSVAPCSAPLAPCMDMHRFTLVCISLYIYIQGQRDISKIWHNIP